MKTIRCAIYTRKSSDEGLEQGFNSLDAQREACAAYILSQASEGWVALPEVYDDGGISGGTLERPALQRLLAEVAAGRIDIIVVYKVDRLTRSLLDFSKLVEAFDKVGTSFVSITQSFNTTTSMGRLTLNMLLSFAQFEREVTAERIRDKIAASKAKGMWMGGIPPLGYKPDGRSLKIVKQHAVIVRDIFERYLALGNVRYVAEQLERDRILSPVRIKAKSNQPFGGVPLTRGQIYGILKNPIYVGEVHHRDQVYPGLHKPIIDRDIWDRTQAMLAGNLQGHHNGVHAAQPSALAGRVFDEDGEPLIAAHACKGSARYRYYVSAALQRGDAKVGVRIPAQELEAAVATTVADALGDPLTLAGGAGIAVRPDALTAIGERCAAAAERVRGRAADRLSPVVERVDLEAEQVRVTLAPSGLAQLLGVGEGDDRPALNLHLPVRLTRTGRVLRLVQQNGKAVTSTGPSGSLVRLLAQAHQWNERLRSGETDIKRLAAAVGRTSSYVTRVVRLAYLAPDVTAAMLQGGQKAGIGAHELTQTDAIPASWTEQRRLFLPSKEAKCGAPWSASR